MKKYIGAVIVLIGLVAFIPQTAHASFFGNIINDIFGAKHTGLGAMASPISAPDTSDTTFSDTPTTTTTKPTTVTPTTTAKTTTSTTSVAPAAAASTSAATTSTSVSTKSLTSAPGALIVPSVSTPSPTTTTPTPTCKIKSFVANPSTITAGGSSTLTWTTSGCSYTGLSGLGNDYSANDSATVSPTTTTTYGLTAFSNSGNQSAATMVTVTPAMVLPAGCTSTSALTSAYSSTTGIACIASGINGIPSVTVLSPHGGETYQAGQQMTVTWAGTNFPSNGVVNIALENEATLNGVTGGNTYLVSNGSNTGSATVTIPSTIAPGSSYKIRVFCGIAGSESYCGSKPLSEDRSDSTFTIIAPSSVTTPTLPAGCTSTVGYSSTTGAPCSGTPSTTVYPAGCVSSIGYSVTTGQPCNTGSSATKDSLTISKDPNDYNDHVVAAQANSSTVGITLGQIDLTAQGSPISLHSLPVHLSVFNSAGIATDIMPLVSTLRLYNANGIQLDSEAVTSNLDIVFHNLPSTVIAAGSTQVFTIKGDINAFNNSIISNGISAQVGISSPGATGIEAYDSSNKLVALTGTYLGSKVTFYVNGIQVSSNAQSGTATASAIGGNQAHNVLGFTVPFSVTAFGQQAYVPDTATAASSASAAHTIQFCIDTANGACQAVGTGVITYAGSDNLIPDGNGNYVIAAGITKNFMLQVTYTANGAASYRASLLNVNWSNVDFTSGGNIFTAGLNSNQFKTNYVSAQ